MNDDVLKNLGKALYIHKALMKTAEDAKDAVDYLEYIGILDCDVDNMSLVKSAYVNQIVTDKYSKKNIHRKED